MPPFLKNLTILLLIFLVSLSLNLVQSFLIASPVSSLYGDMAGYLERALRLLSRSTFSSYDRLYASGTSKIYVSADSHVCQEALNAALLELANQALLLR